MKKRRLPTAIGNAYLLVLIHTVAICLMFVLHAPAGYGGEFHNALSLQGFTGLLNTPNAEVTDEGTAYLLYSNQIQNQWRDRFSYENNYMFSVGLFSFAEIGGRLMDRSGEGQHDLSANFKVRVPFIPRGTYLPQVAFGMQDVGGGAKNLQTKYAVATEEWWRFRFSLGYGTGPDRMDGVFGGVELKTFDWLYLIGEHDTKEKNLGIRLVSPDLFGLPVKLQATAKTSLDYRAGHMEYGIGLQIPLGFDDRGSSKTEAREAKEAGREGAAQEGEATKAAASEGERTEGRTGGLLGESSAPLKPAQTAREALERDRAEQEKGGEPSGRADSDGGLRRLQEKLLAGGFQNIRIGADAEKALLVVEYENRRYNHNELDGLGVVAGLAVDTVSPDFEMIQVIIRKKGIRVLQVSFVLADFREFLQDPGNRAQLNAGLEMTPNVQVDEVVHFIDGDADVGPSWLNSELIVYPGLKTFVGTEVGLFDYLLSVKPDYYLNTWKGAVLNAGWNIPVAWSENFDSGKPFRSFRESSTLERVMLLQAVKVAPRVMFNLGAGMVLKDTYGTVNELMWTPGSGNHRFALKHAYLRSSEEQATYQSNSAYLGSYRYFFGPLDLYLEGTAGQFIDRDRGFTVELKRFFGDTAFSLYYKNSRTEERPSVTGERVQMAGVQISIPLTPRRDMKPLATVQVRGTDEFRHAQGTRIATDANFIGTSIGQDLVLPYNLERVYYNRDRLSEDYVRNHLLRLRDAYLREK